MIKQIIKISVLTAILSCSLYTAYKMGYNANNEPVSELVTINAIDYQLRVPRRSIYEIQRFEDNTGCNAYSISIYTDLDIYNIVYFSDTINGVFVSAEELKDSFIMAMEGN